jgi:hypothetical protein
MFEVCSSPEGGPRTEAQTRTYGGENGTRTRGFRTQASGIVRVYRADPVLIACS